MVCWNGLPTALLQLLEGWFTRNKYVKLVAMKLFIVKVGLSWQPAGSNQLTNLAPEEAELAPEEPELAPEEAKLAPGEAKSAPNEAELAHNEAKFALKEAELAF